MSDANTTAHDQRGLNLPATPKPFLERIARYGGGGNDQRENRLTEVTAATIEHAEGFGSAFAAALLRDPPTADSSWQVQRVHTQKPESGRWVDLVLEVQTPHTAEDHLVWVEVKYGSGFHGDQLCAYRKRLRDLRDPAPPERRHLFALVPSTSSLADEFQEGCNTCGSRERCELLAQEVPLVTVYWEDVATALQEAKPQDADPVTAWLWQGYLTYLNHGGLVYPDELTPEDIGALEIFDRARSAIEYLRTQTTTRLESAWQVAEQKPSRRNGEFWQIHQPPAPLPEGWWLEWGLAPASAFSGDPSPVDLPGNTLVFYAGVVYDPDKVACESYTDLVQFDPGVTGRHGFCQTSKGGYRRWICWWPAASILGEGSISNQSQRVADCVDATFTEVTKHPPPTLAPAARDAEGKP